MDILLSTDNNYVMQTGVLMTSISANNYGAIEYHILLNGNVTAGNKELLKQTAEKNHHNISFYDISDEMVRSFPMLNKGMPSHVSVATYYRLLISDILPATIHKIIYLDGDMIVRKPITELWESDISEYALGAVHDTEEQTHISSQRLPYPMEYGYFNAGMLLINLDYWREHNVSKVFSEFINKFHDKILLHDQDVLNSVFYNSKKWLPVTYNFQDGFLLSSPAFQHYVYSVRNEIERCEKDPAIIHFSYIDKPWLFKCMHPQRFVWRYYKRHSLWKSIPIDSHYTLKEKLSLFLKKNNFWLFDKNTSIHRNIYKRAILRR